MKAVKSSVYSAAAKGFFFGVYLEFLRESALCPLDEDLLLITEPGFTERYA